MRSIWRELVREGRWLWNSGAATGLIVVSVVAAVTGVVSWWSSTRAAISAFQETAERYRAQGLDIAAALRAPAGLSGDHTHEIVDNSLRYDLDRAVAAITQLEPAGAAASVLSMWALVGFPLVGFALGIFVATHDVKSGSIAVRWPRSGAAAFAVSKPFGMVLSLAALAGAIGLLAIPLSSVARAMVGAEATPFAAFAAEGPSVDRVLAVAALGVLIGSASASFGLLVGAATRNRTFTLTGFSVAYLVLPILGSFDPRNALAAVGSDVFYFATDFHPRAVGATQPWLALLVIAGGGIVFVGLSTVVWLTRSRVERHA